MNSKGWSPPISDYPGSVQDSPLYRPGFRQLRYGGCAALLGAITNNTAQHQTLNLGGGMPGKQPGKIRLILDESLREGVKKN